MNNNSFIMKAKSRQSKEIGFNVLSRQYLFPQDIVDTVREPILVLDSELRVIYANRPFYHNFKVNKSETLGKYLYELGSGQWDIRELRELLKSIVSENEVVNDYEISHRFPEIGNKVMILNARKIQRKEKEMILLVIKDITERKKTEYELLETKKKYYSLVEELNSIIIGLDSNGVITFFNSFSEQLFKYKRDEVLGKKFVPAIVPFVESDGTDNSDLIKRMSESPEEYYNKKTEGLTKEKEKRIFLWSLKKRENEELFEFLIDGNDITEAERARKHSEELQDELIRKDRLSDLGVLSASVAHELRNPLATVKMAASSIRKKKSDPDEVEKKLDIIEKKIKEASSIIDNLLTFSNIKVSAFEDINISDIIREALFSVKTIFPQKDVAVVQDLQDVDGLKIKADPVQISDIFKNVAQNSYQAIQKEGSIHIKGRRVGGHIIVTVRDSGKGIAEKDLASVFEPFFTTKAQGTGLGLSIIKEYVKMHGGEIKIESQFGQGTTVILKLPIKR